LTRVLGLAGSTYIVVSVGKMVVDIYTSGLASRRVGHGRVVGSHLIS
jgi:hypothetical protein